MPEIKRLSTAYPDGTKQSYNIERSFAENAAVKVAIKKAWRHNRWMMIGEGLLIILLVICTIIVYGLILECQTLQEIGDKLSQ